jgi:hypothetical protein
MSDLDAQIIVLHDIIKQNDHNYFYYIRKFNKSLVLDFNFKLIYESWDNVFLYDDTNVSFNNFLNTYLRILYSSFPIKEIHYTSHTKEWLKQGIKISCINKKKLFLNSRNSNDCEIKNYYKKYCKVLADMIELAKKIRYNNLSVNSSNETKIAWNIINENINKRPQKNDISFLNIKGTIIHNSQVTANTFNTYFSTVAQHIHTENFKNSNSGVSENNPLNYLYNAFKQLISSIKLKFVSPNEIEDVVSSLKTKDSHGYDGMSTKILKQSIPYISSPLILILLMWRIW